MGTHAPQGMSTGPNSGEDYKFCDERYSREILKRLNKLRESNIMCDVVIKIGNAEFPAHRNILSASSDYFLAMFNGNMKESNERTIFLNGIGADTMRAILNFIYTGEILLNKANVENILQAANLLLVQTVKEACCRFLESRLTISNALAIQLFAEVYACEELHTIASEFIYQNFSYVAETDDFLSLTPRQLALLLHSDEINTESEEKVYEAMVRWIKSDIRARRQHFPELVKHIRLPLISPYYLVDFIEKESLFNMTPSCRSLLLEAQHYHMLPERRVEIDSHKTKPRQYEKLHESLMVVGGNGDITPLTTVFSYNTMKDVWTELPKLSKERGYHGICGVGSHVYIAGGYSCVNSETLSTVKCYDARDKTWHYIASMNAPRSKLSMAEVTGIVYAMGGFDGTTTLNTVESLTLCTNKWKTIAPMPSRRRCTCAVSHGIFVYVLGGHDGSNILNTVERYDTTKDEWSATHVNQMHDRRSFPCAVVVEDRMFCIGGYDGNDTLRTGEVYDFDTNQWSPIPSMHVARSNAGASVHNKKIYIVGGWDGVSLSSAEVYDVVIGEWKRIANLPRPTTGVRCCFISLQNNNSDQKPLRQRNSKGHICKIM